MQILTPTKTYSPVGRCIYCGQEPDSDEHIIPFGIGGRLLLPDASCGDCRRATSRAESKVQNDLFGTLRTRVKFPLRGRKKARRGRVKITLGTPDRLGATISIPAKDYPASITLPLFPPPEELLGPWKEAPQFVTLFPRKQMEALGAKYGPGRGPLMKWHAVTFFQVLAKVGYSFAVAEAGEAEVATFNSRLPMFIRFGAETPPTDLIGGVMQTLPRNNQLHQISLWTGLRERTETQILVANVRFFSHYGTPAYQVVVGQRPFTSRWVGQPVLVP